jgi:hypothetical protein
VIIAAGAAVASAGFCIVVFSQVILPDQVAKLEISIAKMANDSAAQKQSNLDATAFIKSLQVQLKEREDKLAASANQAQDLKNQLTFARAGHLFSPGSPYPTGLGMVRLGSPLAALSGAYPGVIPKFDDDGEFVTVAVPNSPITEATYYFDKATADKRITHILFTMRVVSEYPEGFLQGKLEEAFGPATAHPSKRGIGGKSLGREKCSSPTGSASW